MTDKDTWDCATAAITAEFSRLPAGMRATVATAAAAIKACKAELQAVVSAVDAGTVCSSCGGACCMSGKYHFTAVDQLVYLVDDRELFEPGFGQGRCPYLGSRGCLMTPDYRPLTCIIFNCDLVEGLLDPTSKELLRTLEKELRGHYASLERLFGRRLMGGVLMDGERPGLTDRRTVLDGADGLRGERTQAVRRT
jgi:hypothetical protein